MTRTEAQTFLEAFALDEAQTAVLDTIYAVIQDIPDDDLNLFPVLLHLFGHCLMGFAQQTWPGDRGRQFAYASDTAAQPLLFCVAQAQLTDAPWAEDMEG